MAGAVVNLATKLDFASLEDLEAGFADRVGADAVFLSRALLGDAPDDLDVGAPVHVVIETARGERALSFHGIVAWAYPPSPRTPPGREPGAGILIERLEDDDTRARVERMRRRPGAGGRVRAPGTRLPPLRLTVKAPSSPPRPAGVAPEAVVVEAAVPPPRLPASLFGGAGDDDDGDNEVTVPMPPSPKVAPPVVAAPQAPRDEIVVSHPPAPPPRVMAMGLLVDQTVDPTPAPGPMPLPPAPADVLPAPEIAAAHELDEPPPPLEIPGVTDAVPVARAPVPPSDAGRELSLDALPDAPEAPVGALEQRQTDVDLLMSLDDADFFPAELEEQRAKAAAGLAAARSSGEADKRRLADDADEPSSPLPASPAVNPALQEETVTQWGQLDDAPSADADVEMIADADIEAVDDASAEHVTMAAGRAAAHATAAASMNAAREAVPPVSTLSIPTPDIASAEEASPPPMFSSSQLDAAPADSDEGGADHGIERSLDDDSTGEIGARGLSLDSIDSAEFETAEHTAVALSPLPPGTFDTEHGDAVVHSTAEATASDDRSALSLPPRALPDLEPFLPPGPPAPGIMGVAFMVSHKRATAGDPIVSLEPFSWPRRGTKRWSAIDEAREAGGDALDEVISSSPWLSRDASARDPASFESGQTDPGVDVAAVVEKAVALAAEDEDSVFSDAPPDVRPPMRPELDGDTHDSSELPEEARAALADSSDEDSDEESDDGDGSGEMTLDENEGLRRALDRAAGEAGDAPLDGEDTRAGDEGDEFAETARDLKRPPSAANAEARARLNVLQRFLTRPRE